MHQISIIFGPANSNVGEALGITKQFKQFHQENGMFKKCLNEALNMLYYCCCVLYFVTESHIFTTVFSVTRI